MPPQAYTDPRTRRLAEVTPLVRVWGLPGTDNHRGNVLHCVRLEPGQPIRDRRSASEIGRPPCPAEP